MTSAVLRSALPRESRIKTLACEVGLGGGMF